MKQIGTWTTARKESDPKQAFTLSSVCGKIRAHVARQLRDAVSWQCGQHVADGWKPPVSLLRLTGLPLTVRCSVRTDLEWEARSLFSG